MSSTVQVLACIVVVENEHIVYYEEKKAFSNYLSQLNSIIYKYGKIASFSLYREESNATRLLHFVQESKKDHLHFIQLPSTSFKIWCIKDQNLQIAIVVDGYCNTMELEKTLDTIHAQFLSNFIDTQDIPIYIMRIRCRTFIVPILRQFQRKKCKEVIKDFCKGLLFLIACILSCGLLLVYKCCCSNITKGRRMEYEMTNMGHHLEEDDIGLETVKKRPTWGDHGVAISIDTMPITTSTQSGFSDDTPKRRSMREKEKAADSLFGSTDYRRPKRRARKKKTKKGRHESALSDEIRSGFLFEHATGATDLESILEAKPIDSVPTASIQSSFDFVADDVADDVVLKKTKSKPIWGDHVGDDESDEEDSIVFDGQVPRAPTQVTGLTDIEEPTTDILSMDMESKEEWHDDIEVLQDMYEDLNTLVAEQEAVIDTIEQNVEQCRDEVESGTQHIMRAQAYQRKYRVRKLVCILCCGVCIGMYYSLKCMKDICIKWRNSRKLIDNVFADLENMFYLLASLLVKFNIRFNHRNCVLNVIINVFKLIILICIIYPLIFIICVITILPSLFFLLIVRMNKIETDTKKLNKRKEKLDSETKCQRFLRLIQQFIRSSMIFSFIGVYPVIITYIIIPRYGVDNDYVPLVSVGSYLFMILLLQLFGTYRGLKSFSEKNKTMKNIEQKYKPKRFKWNLGSLIAIILLFYEMVQFTVFASHIVDNENNGNTETDNSSTNDRIESSNKVLSFLINITYISFDFISHNIMEFYSFFNIICVGLLLLFFIFRFIFELKKYGKLKHIEGKTDDAQEFYFHSFVGTIIYGHGTLKNLNKFSCKIVSLLSDTLFLIICEKLILILCCTSSKQPGISYLTIDENVVCWKGDHQFYATINLILIGYYIPISVMIAPMFAETDDQDKKEKDEESEKNKSCFKKFISFSSTVSFVKPFLSAITVSKCFMLISATFIFGGDVIGTIISQSISMVSLLLFTLIWSFKELKLNGLTQNKPGFPYGVNLLRVAGFGCGLIGCIVEILRYYTEYIDDSIDFIVLLSVMGVICIVMFIIFKSYHSKYDKLDDDITLDWVIKYSQNDKRLQVIPFEIGANDKKIPDTK